MRGSVFPRPAKRVTDKKGRVTLAPMKAHEQWTDPHTGKIIVAGPHGSSWSWSFTTGTRTAGNRRTWTRGGFRIRKDAQEALTEALRAHRRGDARPLMRPEATPLADYLKGWLAGREDLRPSSRRGYENVITAWVRPHIGRVPLRDLSADDLAELYSTLREKGARRGKPLGPRSVQLVHTVLRMALADAVEAGRLAYNPAERIPRRQRPKHTAEKRADKFWSPDEARRFLDATRDDRLWALWCLALDSGARRGELSALRWEALDLDAAVMHVTASRTLTGAHVVTGPTKSRKARKVDLDPRTVGALRGWKAGQARERLAAGEVWQGGVPGDSGYVWTDEAGDPYRPDRLATFFGEAQTGLGLPRMVFHAMRHTSATVALSAGVPITLVSERLGHSKVSITLDVYAHAVPSHGADAAKVIGGVLYGEVGS